MFKHRILFFCAVTILSVGSVAIGQQGILCDWEANTYGQTDVPAGENFIAIAPNRTKTYENVPDRPKTYQIGP